MKPKKTGERVPPESAANDHDARLAGLHILIVEDMGLIAGELRTSLEELNCSVVGIASRVDEAMELVKSAERLDGALLDLNLAGVNSYPVAEVLRERGVPFIIMSGYDSSYIHDDCADDPHLQKPFTTQDLKKAMLNAFRD